jgi:serine protease Do
MTRSNRIRSALIAVLLIGCGFVIARSTETTPAQATAAPAIGSPAPSAAPPVITRDRPDSFADLSERLLPSVVNISTIQTIKGGEDSTGLEDMPQFPPGSPFEEFFKQFQEQQRQGSRPRRAASLGSGFVVDAQEGYIVTNNHVIVDADEIKVILQDDTNLTAKLIGRDEKTDLALLQVEPGQNKLTAVPWGNSDDMRVGDWVIAIGNPFGLGGTVTQGIISARARDIQAGPYDDFLQTDASINRGNSGGPLFNLKGEVVGVNSAIFSPTGGSIGIGFAIPANLARSVINQLKEHGRTKRGWLGVRIQVVTPEIAESLNFGTPRGALIASITPEGPAAKAGVEAGDIVLQFDGKPIEEMRRLPRIVAETPVGKDVSIQVWRKGETKNLTVKVAELEQAEEEGLIPSSKSGEEEDEPAPAEAKAYGLSLATLTPALRSQYEIDEKTTGVLITAIDQSSKAAEVDLREGDVITAANQQDIKSPAEFQKQLDTVKAAGRKSIFLLIARGEDLRFVALPLEEPKATDDKPGNPERKPRE